MVDQPGDGSWGGVAVVSGQKRRLGARLYENQMSGLCKTKKIELDNEECLICGDRASGYHYNALSCEGCKGFFRRSISRQAVYKCKFGGECEMDMWMRRKCQYCRLRRCREVGMKEECLLTGEQCRARDIRRKKHPKHHRTHPSAPRPPPAPTCSISSSEPVESASQTDATYLEKLKDHIPAKTIVNKNPLEHMSQAYKELIERIVYLQEKYELPDKEDIEKATVIDPDNNRKSASVSLFWIQLAEFTTLVTKLVINFAQNLPGFLAISKDDQIILLKACTPEVMTLRSTRRYDIVTHSIVMANGMPLTLDIMKGIGMGRYADLIFEFMPKVTELGVDNAEFGLLTAISIFSDRPGLHNPRRVEKIQEVYVEALEYYEMIKRYRGGPMLGKLLCLLCDIRVTSIEHAKMILKVQIDRNDMPQLLREIYMFADRQGKHDEENEQWMQNL